jgi:hypothetical protein
MLTPSAIASPKPDVATPAKLEASSPSAIASLKPEVAALARLEASAPSAIASLKPEVAAPARLEASAPAKTFIREPLGGVIEFADATKEQIAFSDWVKILRTEDVDMNKLATASTSAFASLEPHDDCVYDRSRRYCMAFKVASLTAVKFIEIHKATLQKIEAGLLNQEMVPAEAAIAREEVQNTRNKMRQMLNMNFLRAINRNHVGPVVEPLWAATDEGIRERRVVATILLVYIKLVYSKLAEDAPVTGQTFHMASVIVHHHLLDSYTTRLAAAGLVNRSKKIKINTEDGKMANETKKVEINSEDDKRVIKKALIIHNLQVEVGKIAGMPFSAIDSGVAAFWAKVPENPELEKFCVGLARRSTPSS